jgi:fatty acid synthase subunit alpha
MESQGYGAQVIMSAKTALEMGCAIRGVVAFTSTSTFVSRPPPFHSGCNHFYTCLTAIRLDAPFLHLAVVLSQSPEKSKSITHSRSSISIIVLDSLVTVDDRSPNGWRMSMSTSRMKLPCDLTFRNRNKRSIFNVVLRSSKPRRSEKRTHALAAFRMLEMQIPSIAPLRHALAVWGLTADDIGKLFFLTPRL